MKRSIVLEDGRTGPGFVLGILSEHERIELNMALSLIHSQDWGLIVNAFSLPPSWPVSIDLLSDGDDPPDFFICWPDAKLGVEATNGLPHFPAVIKALDGRGGILPGLSDFPKTQRGRAQINLQEVKRAQEKIGSLSHPDLTNANAETADLASSILRQLQRKDVPGSLIDLVLFYLGLWSEGGPAADAMRLAMDRFSPTNLKAVAFLFSDGRCQVFTQSKLGSGLAMARIAE